MKGIYKYIHWGEPKGKYPSSQEAVLIAILPAFGDDIQLWFKAASQNSAISTFGNFPVVRDKILILKAELWLLFKHLPLWLNAERFLLGKLCYVHVKGSWPMDNAIYCRELPTGNQFLFCPLSLIRQSESHKLFCTFSESLRNHTVDNKVLKKEVELSQTYELCTMQNISETLTCSSDSLKKISVIKKEN